MNIMISNIDLRAWRDWPEGASGFAAGFFFGARSTASDFTSAASDFKLAAAAGRFISLPVLDSTAADGRFKLTFGLALAFSLLGGGGSVFFGFSGADFDFGPDFVLALGAVTAGAA